MDSASRIPPAASLAIRSIASGSAARPSASRIIRIFPAISGTVRRRRSNRWRRDRMAAGNPAGSVEANMKLTNSGGSSSVLSRAPQASLVI